MADKKTINNADRWVAITAADSNLAEVPRAVFVGVAGTLVCTDSTGAVVTFTAPQGLLPIQPVRIAAASTATGIVALY